MQRLLPTLVILSLALCAACGGLWVRSWRTSDSFAYVGGRGRVQYGVLVGAGTILLTWGPTAPGISWTGFGWWSEAVVPSDFQHGFGALTAPGVRGAWFPIWAVIVPTLTVPVWWTLRRRRRRGTGFAVHVPQGHRPDTDRIDAGGGGCGR